MSRAPTSSIVIVSWNGRQYLDPCLNAVAAQQGVQALIGFPKLSPKFLKFFHASPLFPVGVPGAARGMKKAVATEPPARVSR